MLTAQVHRAFQSPSLPEDTDGVLLETAHLLKQEKAQ